MTSEATRRRIEGNIDRSFPHPIPLDADAALSTTPTADLLTAAYALTHRIHVVSSTADDLTQYGPRRVAAEQRRDDLRAQRDAITAEVLRRTALHEMPLPHPDLPGLTHHKRARIEREQDGQ